MRFVPQASSPLNAIGINPGQVEEKQYDKRIDYIYYTIYVFMNPVQNLHPVKNWYPRAEIVKNSPPLGGRWVCASVRGWGGWVRGSLVPYWNSVYFSCSLRIVNQSS